MTRKRRWTWQTFAASCSTCLTGGIIAPQPSGWIRSLGGVGDDPTVGKGGSVVGPVGWWCGELGPSGRGRVAGNHSLGRIRSFLSPVASMTHAIDGHRRLRPCAGREEHGHFTDTLAHRSTKLLGAGSGRSYASEWPLSQAMASSGLVNIRVGLRGLFKPMKKLATVADNGEDTSSAVAR